MLRFVTLLLLCQLAGELIALAAGLPVPGPVLGMVLLFAGLVARGRVPDGLRDVAGGLLRHLSLLFVPAGTGIIVHLDRLAAEALPIVVAVVGSTVLAIAVTARLMAALLRRLEGGR
ncbi:CidA/LrgA family protein [Azospirillum sp. ST 5-10]|uniref:CidA/LrgA family protein n=1 Tax=unclassified Azospirillum TaxID=2630922 RepID=UPI003F49C940